MDEDSFHLYFVFLFQASTERLKLHDDNRDSRNKTGAKPGFSIFSVYLWL